MRIAIVGSRTPTDAQREYVKRFVAGLEAGTTVISGCAKGIDTLALQTAKKRGLRTICFVPFEKKYSFADEVYVMSSLSEDLRREAYASVDKYHPAKGGGKISRIFHARNYLIVKNADLVLALPRMDKHSGTWQAIRLSKGMGIPCTVIGEDGNELTDFSKYL